jgi:hypothetical protein
MTSFPTPTILSANDGTLPRQPHCGTGASASCTCVDCGPQRARGEAAVQAGSTTAAPCRCAACNCATCNCA